MEVIKTKNPKFTIRFATPEDAGLVVDFMRKLGTYQKMRDKITATEEGIAKLLASGQGEAIFGDYDGETVAFCYFYNDSSAFTGVSSIYIDGFYIEEEIRFQGLGKIMMSFLSKLAIERGCGRLGLGCLDWNEPSIKFYKELGAYGVDIMTIYRFSTDKLKENADNF